MAQITSTFYRDANGVPIWTDGLIAKKTITFAGGTADAYGNDGGALDPFDIFTVTGLVYARVVAICVTSLDGATSTLSTGITGDTAIFHPVTTCTAIDAGEIWLNNATPATYYIVGEQQAAADNLPEYMLNGNDIIGTVATSDVTAGVLDYYCIWRPVSSDANVVAA